MRLRLPRLGVAAALAIAAAPVAAGPMTLAPTGHLITAVRLNGTGPFDFVIDTCASASVIATATTQTLGLSPQAGGQASIHGASGNGAGALFRLERVDVDGRTHGPLTVAALPPPPGSTPAMAGVLGVDVLGGYVAEFDVPGGRFRLHDPATDLAASGRWMSLPLSLNRARFPVLEGALDGRPLHVLFDTGARRTLINWAAARQLGLVPGGPGLTTGGAVHGATPQRIETVTHAFGTIAIGGLTIPAGEIVIADLPVFGPLGWSEQPAMILGMDRMGAYRFAVDYPRSRLLVAAAQAAAR